MHASRNPNPRSGRGATSRALLLAGITGALLVGTASQALGYGRGTFEGKVVDSGVQREPRPTTPIQLKVKRNKIKVTSVDLVLLCEPDDETATVTVGTGYGKIDRKGNFSLTEEVLAKTSLAPPAPIALFFHGHVGRKKIDVGTVDAETYLTPPDRSVQGCDDEAWFRAKKKK
jgi:hypothetical protein